MTAATDRTRHSLDHLWCQFGINRQSQAFFRSRFADGEISGLETEVSEANLMWKRDRIVNLTSDSLLLEMRHQLVAPGAANGELIVDVPRIRNFVRQLYPRVTRKGLPITVGVSSTPFRACIKAFQIPQMS